MLESAADPREVGMSASRLTNVTNWAKVTLLPDRTISCLLSPDETNTSDECCELGEGLGRLGQGAWHVGGNRAVRRPIVFSLCLSRACLGKMIAETIN
jgi:hypothetical protein